MESRIRSVGGRLRAAREERHLTREALSRQVGIGQTTAWRAETSGDVRLDTVVQIARALDLEIVLVPRHLVPAVEAILSGGTNASRFDVDDERPYDEAYDEPSVLE